MKTEMKNLILPVSDQVCPFNGIHICTASLASMKIDSQKKPDVCNSEDYDNCPLFLSKVLRSRFG